MRKTALLVAYLTLFTSAIAAAQTAQYRHNGRVVLNDLTVTPGQIDPTHDRAFLCSAAFRTGSIRNVTKSTKWKVCDEYGIARKDCNKVNVEIDHLVPLEDGGTNDISNAATFGDHRWVCKISSTPKAGGAATAVRSGRGRSQALGSKVRFADKPGATDKINCDRVLSKAAGFTVACSHG